MTASILQQFRNAGDANIGQTLIRLAKLAEARHAHEVAWGQAIDPSNVDVQDESSRKVTPAHGSGRSVVVGDDLASFHMEVER